MNNKFAIKKTCSQCKRLLTLKQNRFGDLIYPRHRMATISGYKTGQMPQEVSAEFRWSPNVNVDAAALWEIDCPNSGQPV